MTYPPTLPPRPSHGVDRSGLSRRSVLQLAGGAASLGAVPVVAAHAASPAGTEAAEATTTVRLTVNGEVVGQNMLDAIVIRVPPEQMDRMRQTPEQMNQFLDQIATGQVLYKRAVEEGIHTEVRERGSRLSAGERQLVSLARAALVDPAVLVLDEATSNLDPGTESIVEQALERLMADRTTIVVAHRLSTVRRADRIAVIDHGELTELGSHDELVAGGGRYAALADAWARSQPVV